MSPGFAITPPMTPERAREIAAGFDLRALPADFYANPYPVYALLRETRAGASACPTARTSSPATTTSWRCTATRRPSAPTRRWSSRRSTAPDRRCWSTTPPAWCSTTRRCTRACASSSWARSRAGRSPRWSPAWSSLVDGLLDRIEARGGGDLIEDFAIGDPGRDHRQPAGRAARRPRAAARLVARDPRRARAPAHAGAGGAGQPQRGGIQRLPEGPGRAPARPPR